MKERKPIFYDEHRRRWWLTRRVMEVSGGVITMLLIIFSLSVFSKPNLPSLLLPEARPMLHAVRPRPASSKPQTARAGRRKRVAALGEVPDKYGRLRAAFYVPWDNTSLASLQSHYKDLDLLIPEALHSVSADGRLDIEFDSKLHDWLQALQANKTELPTMALLNNSDGRIWHVKELAEMLANTEARQRLVDALMKYAVSTNQAGIVVDFEDVPDKSQKLFRQFGAELAAALHGANKKFMIALPARDPIYDYRYFASQADAIILMNYDQHWLTSPPGPIASQDWFVRNLNDTLREVPPEKLVMGIASYGYDWAEAPKKGEPPEAAQSISFQQALLTASESEAEVQFDSDSLNPYYSYYDEHNHIHQVWFLDAVTAYNELRVSERAGIYGTALWRLGTADSSIWPIWDAIHADDATRAKIQEVPPGQDLVIEGDGDIWKISATPEAGRRSFDYDPATDTFTDESFQKYAFSYRIEALGAARGKIALTFDDGPDSRFTPQILNILKEKHAPATFSSPASRGASTLACCTASMPKGTKSATTRTPIRTSTRFHAASWRSS